MIPFLVRVMKMATQMPFPSWKTTAVTVGCAHSIGEPLTAPMEPIKHHFLRRIAQ